MKNHLFNNISLGLEKRTTEVTAVNMNKLEPSKTEIPNYIPSISASSLADKLAKTSEAPAPNASNVTPANDSEILNVVDIFYKDGDKCSSATNDK